MKQKRLYSIILVLALIISTFFSSGTLSLAAEMEGSGTEESPYIIRTVAHLYSIPTGSTSHYKLANDLDFKNAKRTPLPEFSGIFDGNGFVIKNIAIQNEPEGIHTGLFSSLSNAVVKNLSIINAEVTSTSAGIVATTGVLAGNAADCYFYNCSTMGGSVKANNDCGGLVGTAHNSDFFRCYSTVPVIVSGYYGGGLTGDAVDVTFQECFTNSTISGENYLGGFTGYQSGEVIYTNCYANNRLVGTASDTTVGVASGSMTPGNFIFTNCYFVTGLLAAKSSVQLSSASNCYIDNTIALIEDLDNTQARTTEEMYTEINYNTWDFENIWMINEGKDYPKLRFTDNSSDLKLKLVLEKGENINLEFLYDDTDGTTVWDSSDPSVVSVDQNGNVNALKAGESTIAIGNMAEPFMDYIYILVVDDLENQRITVRLKENASIRLTADNNKNKEMIIWSVLDPNIASVSSKGKVTAAHKGITVITAYDFKTGNEIGSVYIKVK